MAADLWKLYDSQYATIAHARLVITLIAVSNGINIDDSSLMPTPKGQSRTAGQQDSRTARAGGWRPSEARVHSRVRPRRYERMRKKANTGGGSRWGDARRPYRT
ncbi:hypothetical protein GCM10010264_33170 [Streptomyces globisporus]|nr:hypothetical protein GCM10010264_33170 [Streptomyces globisporus]